MIGVYKITNNVNGKVYIGQAEDIELRWKQHVKASKRGENSVLYRAMRKYGVENFSFEVVEECSVEELKEKEIYYIGEFNSYIHAENSQGYNMTLGGDGVKGWNPTEEQREKMSQAKKLYTEGGDNIYSNATEMNNEVVRKIINEFDLQTAMFYMVLLSHRNPKTNECYPSILFLSEELRISVSTVKRCLKKLADNGFIIINSGERGISNTYFFPLESFYKGEGLGAVRKLWKQK